MSNKKNTKNSCSFCGRPENEVQLLLAGLNGYICDECIQRAEEIMREAGMSSAPTEHHTPHNDTKSIPTPSEIKAHLDQYVIGQEEAKKVLSVAVYNHYKRLKYYDQHGDKNDVEIEKSNIIIVGETGTGKTLMARTIAKMLKMCWYACFRQPTMMWKQLSAVLSLSMKSTRLPAKAKIPLSPATCRAKECNRRYSNCWKAPWSMCRRKEAENTPNKR